MHLCNWFCDFLGYYSLCMLACGIPSLSFSHLQEKLLLVDWINLVYWGGTYGVAAQQYLEKNRDIRYIIWLLLWSSTIKQTILRLMFCNHFCLHLISNYVQKRWNERSNSIVGISRNFNDTLVLQKKTRYRQYLYNSRPFTPLQFNLLITSSRLRLMPPWSNYEIQIIFWKLL